MNDLRAFAGAKVISFPSGSTARGGAAAYCGAPVSLADRAACWL